MFQLVRAGPSTSKHFPGLAGPSHSSTQVSPSQVWRLLVITPACRSREPPGPGSTQVSRYPGRELAGTSAPAAGQLGLKVPTTKAVKRGKERPSSNPSACIASAASFEWTGPQGQAAMPTNKHTQQASNPTATVNHCQPLRRANGTPGAGLSGLTYCSGYHDTAALYLGMSVLLQGRGARSDMSGQA